MPKEDKHRTHLERGRSVLAPGLLHSIEELEGGAGGGEPYT